MFLHSAVSVDIVLVEEGVDYFLELFLVQAQPLVAVISQGTEGAFLPVFCVFVGATVSHQYILISYWIAILYIKWRSSSRISWWPSGGSCIRILKSHTRNSRLIKESEISFFPLVLRKAPSDLSIGKERHLRG